MFLKSFLQTCDGIESRKRGIVLQCCSENLCNYPTYQQTTLTTPLTTITITTTTKTTTTTTTAAAAISSSSSHHTTSSLHTTQQLGYYSRITSLKS
jgi:hypothetical protein